MSSRANEYKAVRNRNKIISVIAKVGSKKITVKKVCNWGRFTPCSSIFMILGGGIVERVVVVELLKIGNVC